MKDKIELKIIANLWIVALFLTVSFLALKLTGIIGWSYWFVFLPVIILLAFNILSLLFVACVVFVMFCFGFYFAMLGMSDSQKNRNKTKVG